VGKKTTKKKKVKVITSTIQPVILIEAMIKKSQGSTISTEAEIVIIGITEKIVSEFIFNLFLANSRSCHYRSIFLQSFCTTFSLPKECFYLKFKLANISKNN
jgi:hypothetical protein